MAVYVGGNTAIFADFSKVLTSKLPLFIGLVVVLSFLLLSLVFRSLVIPLTAAVMNLLSIGAAFGVLVAVFQWGWLSAIFGVNRAGPVESFLPVMLFAILFGLSMDYEVFLVSRIHEEWVKCGDSREAVRKGLAATGKTITAAALIMILVFGSFMFGGQRVIKEFGLGLAAGILIDAVIIRMTIVPALMFLFGQVQLVVPRLARSAPAPPLGRRGRAGAGGGHRAQPAGARPAARLTDCLRRHPGIDPAPEGLYPFVWPGAVARHRSVLHPLEDRRRVGTHVVVGPQVELATHRVTIALPEERLDVRRVAGRTVIGGVHARMVTVSRLPKLPKPGRSGPLSVGRNPPGRTRFLAGHHLDGGHRIRGLTAVEFDDVGGLTALGRHCGHGVAGGGREVGSGGVGRPHLQSGGQVTDRPPSPGGDVRRLDPEARLQEAQLRGVIEHLGGDIAAPAEGGHHQHRDPEAKADRAGHPLGIGRQRVHRHEFARGAGRWGGRGHVVKSPSFSSYMTKRTVFDHTSGMADQGLERLVDEPRPEGGRSRRVLVVAEGRDEPRHLGQVPAFDILGEVVGKVGTNAFW